MKRTWTENDLRILRKEYPYSNIQELAGKLGKTFNSVRAKAKALGVRRDVSVRRWTPEKMEKLVVVYPCTRNRDIARAFGVSEGSVCAMAFKMRLRKTKEFMRGCASKGAFRKGHIPANKGKRQTEFMTPEQIERSAVARFRKGHVPANHKPVGYERVNADGYVEVKVSEPDRFMLKHRLVWEQAYGSIPKGYNVQFKDGNRRNLSLDNLYIISRSDQLKKENSMYARYPEEVVSLIKLKGALKRQINKVGKWKQV